MENTSAEYANGGGDPWPLLLLKVAGAVAGAKFVAPTATVEQSRKPFCVNPNCSST
jgi:hypothetical protein